MAEKYHDALMNRLDMINGLGQNATSLANAAQARKMPEIVMPSPNWGAAPQQQSAGGSSGTASTGRSGGSLDSFLKAISGQESGGNYNARNKDSGAMGKYQIMPSNISGNRGWDYEALGRNISTSQFMGSPELQEQIAQYKLTQYYNKYGAAGAAVAWYAGPGAVAGYLKNPSKYTNPQGAYPSIANYVNSVLGRQR